MLFRTNWIDAVRGCWHAVTPLSWLDERKQLKNFNWGYNPAGPKGAVLQLATLEILDLREDALLSGEPEAGRSHIAKTLARIAVDRGQKVMQREGHQFDQGH